MGKNKIERIGSFKIIGIETEMFNENSKSAKDVGNLWKRFYSENVPSKIPNKISDDIYSIYTDYQSDYKGKYKTIIGQMVSSLGNVPDGLVGREFNGGKYLKIIAKGLMPNAIIEKWQEIWVKDKELNRIYTADFEVYGKNSQTGENSEVAIYLATE